LSDVVRQLVGYWMVPWYVSKSDWWWHRGIWRKVPSRIVFIILLIFIIHIICWKVRLMKIMQII
jgi:hypothetical protein